MDIRTTFAARLKELRGDMSQAEFGEKIGVSRGSISYFENGSRTADIVIIDKICQVFNVSADWILGLSDIKTTDITVQSICNYTGLSEAVVDSISKRKNSPINEDGFYFDFLNEIFETPAFFFLLHSMKDYKAAIIAQDIYDKIAHKYFDDSKGRILALTPEEGEVQAQNVYKEIDRIIETSECHNDVLKFLKANRVLWAEQKNALVNALTDFDLFDISDVYVYRINNNLAELLDLIARAARHPEKTATEHYYSKLHRRLKEWPT